MQAMHFHPSTCEPRRIAVALCKGGVGKTTMAVNLATGLALCGKKVLLVDTDIQGHVGCMLGVENDCGLNELTLQECAVSEAILPLREKFDVLLGGKALAALKRSIGRKDFAGEKMVGDALRQCDTHYDYVILDTAPGWDSLLVNVLFYATEILCPVTLDTLALRSLREFFKNSTTIQKFHTDRLNLGYIVPSFFNKSLPRQMALLGELHETYGKKLCNPVRFCTSVDEAAQSGRSVFEFAPGAPGTEDYRSLVRKVAKDDTLLR